MSREIKFRAWDLKEKKMYYSPYCIDSQNMGGSICVTPGDKGCEDGKMGLYYGEEIDFELMQYLNLKDINGQKIYEGDVYIGVEDPYEEHYLVDLHETIYRHYSDIRDHSGTGSAEWEVVGNIRENPELRERI